MARPETQDSTVWREDADSIAPNESVKLVSHVPWPRRDEEKASSTLTVRTNVFDKRVDFLIDSGAECSLIPIRLVPASLIVPSNVRLCGVNGSPLKVYGTFSCRMAIPQLRRQLCEFYGHRFSPYSRR